MFRMNKIIAFKFLTLILSAFVCINIGFAESLFDYNEKSYQRNCEKPEGRGGDWSFFGIAPLQCFADNYGDTEKIKYTYKDFIIDRKELTEVRPIKNSRGHHHKPSRTY